MYCLFPGGSFKRGKTKCLQPIRAGKRDLHTVIERGIAGSGFEAGKTWLRGYKQSQITAKQLLKRVSENVRGRNKQCSNRILIHTRSALPSFTV